ncbi:related to FMP52 Found in Mitochondrial Proteome [Phialocephala subalpina]|uniref:Related to FMP52 Found in Mitochondrial Proteome n=1 Tax=Phialocephala subalpina TaxID=576137 RepID=A0A1L7WGR6_9HELO|nr:related to FMP52 Found in Mitochondrial Proteome [Phialocephala subalpina]
MTSTAIVGSTGLVGSHILATLLSLPSISAVHSISRRAAASTDAKLHPLVGTDTAQWPIQLSAITPPPSILFSGLGTTKGAAGSFEAQRKIDYDLNLSLAQAAKSSGVKVYVLISSGGANSKSFIPYAKMKGELEDSVKALEFEHTVILRPGLLVGDRSESRLAEGVFRGVANVMGHVGLKDFWAQDADVVAKAAIAAGLQSLEGGKPKVWEIGQAEIIKLGRTEWKA